ncbi:unnamed protein product, partial [marine sediment metagenome]
LILQGEEDTQTPVFEAHDHRLGDACERQADPDYYLRGVRQERCSHDGLPLQEGEEAPW